MAWLPARRGDVVVINSSESGRRRARLAPIGHASSGGSNAASSRCGRSGSSGRSAVATLNWFDDTGRSAVEHRRGFRADRPRRSPSSHHVGSPGGARPTAASVCSASARRSGPRPRGSGSPTASQSLGARGCRPGGGCAGPWLSCRRWTVGGESCPVDRRRWAAAGRGLAEPAADSQPHTVYRPPVSVPSSTLASIFTVAGRRLRFV